MGLAKGKEGWERAREAVGMAGVGTLINWFGLALAWQDGRLNRWAETGEQARRGAEVLYW